MAAFHQRLQVVFEYRVHFVRGALSPHAPLLAETLAGEGDAPARVLAVLDSGLAAARPGLAAELSLYARAQAKHFRLVEPPLVVPGGEACKNDPALVDRILAAVERGGLCRHSYLLAIGGGALLDLAGYAAALAHRGLRIVRMPSTVLAQNDAGVGVKNGINAFGRKNFLGTFAPPWAVIDDFDLLDTLPERERIGGMAEAVKVALIKDAGFFQRLEQQRHALRRFERGAVEEMVQRTAELHLEHIASGGDPFELGSARPLDFGHWSAHALEEATAGGLRHGEAVAIGMALDAGLARSLGLLSRPEEERILGLLRDLGLPSWHPALERLDLGRALDSFREHLGGQLCLTLPRGIGQRVELHELDPDLLERCRQSLAARCGGGPHESQELPPVGASRPR